MPSSILVAFASKYGSTKEVAEAIATELRNHGVVLGAPLYFGA